MLARWFRTLLGRSRFEQDLRAEMEEHLRMRADDLIAAGESPDEALRRARIEFGAIEVFREECREARGLRWPDEMRRNMAFAARLLRKSPGFTAVVVVTLGLCIGANTAIFSTVDATLLRPLPYPDPDRLALVTTVIEQTENTDERTGQTGGVWEFVRDRITVVDAAVYSSWSQGVGFAYEDQVEFVRQQRIGAGFFRVLGVAPALGREFTPEEDRPGGPPVVILSHAFWQRAFDGNPAALGDSVLLKGAPHVVVGIMPPGSWTEAPAELWTPLRPSTSGEGSGTNYTIVARLKPGTSWPQARAGLRSADLADVQGLQVPADVTAFLSLMPLQEGLTSALRMRLLIAWGAVALVLLIGCVNVAGLLLARGVRRTREIATRMALGGGRGAILRQLLTESLFLALLGGFAGVAVGWAGMRWSQAFAQPTLSVMEPRMDARVFGATFLLALLTSLVFGLFPALRATRMSLGPALASDGTRSVTTPSSHWTRRALVVAQVALAVVLLVGAGLLVRTMLHLHGLEPGFDGSNVMTTTVSLDDVRYVSSEEVNRLFGEVVERIEALPGVQQAAAGLSLPFERALNMPFVRDDGETLITSLTYVTPGYFDTLQIPVLRGRGLDASDRADTRPVIVVNRALTDEYFSDVEALGRYIEIAGESREIVGIVGDVQQTPSWGDSGPLERIPAVYMPALQTTDAFLEIVHTWFPPSWIVRTSGPQEGIVAGMRRAVEDVDPTLALIDFRDVNEVRAEALGDVRQIAVIFSILAGLALFLGAIGIAGLIGSSVTERTSELGIRLTLGSTRLGAIRTAAMPGVVLAGTGILVGSLLAVWLVRMLQALVYGISTTDTVTFLAVAALLLVTAAAASFIPALRIARLDPARTLRQE